MARATGSVGSRWLLAYYQWALVICLAVTCASARIVAMSEDQQPRHALGRLLAADPADACIKAPQGAACKTYVYPDNRATADLSSLCSDMPFMPACSVHAACKRPQGPAAVSKDPKTCAPFQLLATICKYDGMSGMKGCGSYNTLCGDGSLVQQCQDYPGISYLVTTSQANGQLKSICNSMKMDGCEQCTPDWSAGRAWSRCSLLDVYGQVCYDMPDMSQCAAMKQMCSSDNSLYPCCGLLPNGTRWGPTCGSKGEVAGPTMKMYFFTEYPFYLLFKDWVPSSSGQYAGAWFAIFFLAIVFEAVQVVRYRWEVRCMMGDAAAATSSSSGSKDQPGSNGSLQMTAADMNGDATNCCEDPAPLVVAPAEKYSAAGRDSSTGLVGSSQKPGPHWKHKYRLQPQQIAVDVGRSVLQLVVVGLAYLLMLAAMSFNVGIFFAVIGGVAVGSFLFGRFKHYAVLNPDVCCGV